jgi:hypothetical protein
VGRYAFYSCSSLSWIRLPSSVRELGGFEECRSLSSVDFEIGSRLSSIAACAFEGCSSLSSIRIPSSVEQVRYPAFKDCRTLSSVEFELGSKLRFVEHPLFEGCSSLSSICIPASIEELFVECRVPLTRAVPEPKMGKQVENTECVGSKVSILRTIGLENGF